MRHQPGRGPCPAASGDGSPCTVEAGHGAGPPGEARRPRCSSRCESGSAVKTPCTRTGSERGCHRFSGVGPGRSASAAKTPCINCPGPSASQAARGTRERSSGAVDGTPCTGTRRARRRRHPGAGQSGSAARSPYTNSPGHGAARPATGGGERWCCIAGRTPCTGTHRAWSAQRSGASKSGRAAKTPCTNSSGPNTTRPAPGTGERSCGTVSKTPCTRTRCAWTARRPAAGQSGSAAKSPGTNSPGPGAARPARRPCGSGGRTPCTRSRRAGREQRGGVGRPASAARSPCTRTRPHAGQGQPADTGPQSGTPLAASATAHAPKPSRGFAGMMPE